MSTGGVGYFGKALYIVVKGMFFGILIWESDTC